MSDLVERLRAAQNDWPANLVALELEAADHITELEAEITRLRTKVSEHFETGHRHMERADKAEERIKELEAGLKPFAEHWVWAIENIIPQKIADDPSTPVWGDTGMDGGRGSQITVSDLRRAHALLIRAPDKIEMSENDRTIYQRDILVERHAAFSVALIKLLDIAVANPTAKIDTISPIIYKALRADADNSLPHAPSPVRKESLPTEAGGWMPGTIARFVVCPLCFNKRCPKAGAPQYQCTGSNEPNQIPQIDAAFWRDNAAFKEQFKKDRLAFPDSPTWEDFDGQTFHLHDLIEAEMNNGRCVMDKAGRIAWYKVVEGGYVANVKRFRILEKVSIFKANPLQPWTKSLEELIEDDKKRSESLLPRGQGNT